VSLDKANPGLSLNSKLQAQKLFARNRRFLVFAISNILQKKFYPGQRKKADAFVSREFGK